MELIRKNQEHREWMSGWCFDTVSFHMRVTFQEGRCFPFSKNACEMHDSFCYCKQPEKIGKPGAGQTTANIVFQMACWASFAHWGPESVGTQGSCCWPQRHSSVLCPEQKWTQRARGGGNSLWQLPFDLSLLEPEILGFTESTPSYSYLKNSVQSMVWAEE